MTALATALAARLRTVLPATFVVTAAGDELRLAFTPTGESVCAPLDGFVMAPDDLEDGIQRAVASALNTVQDFVSEALHEPWPANPRKGRGYMAQPEAMVSNGTLMMWFGETDDPRLELASISMEDVSREDQDH